jgi:hypothetical protein
MHLLCGHKYTQKDTDFSALLSEEGEGVKRLTIAHGGRSVLLGGGGSGLDVQHKQNVEEVGTGHIVLLENKC